MHKVAQVTLMRMDGNEVEGGESNSSLPVNGCEVLAFVNIPPDNQRDMLVHETSTNAVLPH